MAHNFDAIIAKVVDDIWAEFDNDSSGALDKEETKKFIKKMPEFSGGEELSDEDFEAVFKEFVKDGNGTIEKDEMVYFIKKIAGLCT